MSEGERREVTPRAARDAAVAGEAVLVDCREHREWRGGHARQAVHIPMAAIPDALERLRGRTVNVVCYSGARSARAAGWLRHQGIDAANVTGGMQRWVADGLPMDGDLVH